LIDVGMHIMHMQLARGREAAAGSEPNRDFDRVTGRFGANPSALIVKAVGKRRLDR